MFLEGFFAAILEILALSASILCASLAPFLLIKIVWNWRDPQASKVWPSVILVGLLVIAALLYYVWITQMLFPKFA